jgi:hypothetical protein
MYWVVPPAQLHDVVAAHVNLGARLVPSVPGAARRSLAAAVSELSLLADRIGSSPRAWCFAVSA